MPGVTVDYDEIDTRAARMGGLEARYGYVMLDGGTAASVNTGTFGGDRRQFEAVSTNAIKSIGVNETLSADLSLSGGGGTCANPPVIFTANKTQRLKGVSRNT